MDVSRQSTCPSRHEGVWAAVLNACGRTAMSSVPPTTSAGPNGHVQPVQQKARCSMQRPRSSAYSRGVEEAQTTNALPLLLGPEHTSWLCVGLLRGS